MNDLEKLISTLKESTTLAESLLRELEARDAQNARLVSIVDDLGDELYALEQVILEDSESVTDAELDMLAALAIGAVPTKPTPSLVTLQGLHLVTCEGGAWKLTRKGRVVAKYRQPRAA